VPEPITLAATILCNEFAMLDQVSHQQAMMTLLSFAVVAIRWAGVMVIVPVCERGVRVLSFRRTRALLGLTWIGEIILLGDSPDEFITIDALFRIYLSIFVIDERLNIAGGIAVP